jgi:hypothetical protein
MSTSNELPLIYPILAKTATFHHPLVRLRPLSLFSSSSLSLSLWQGALFLIAGQILACLCFLAALYSLGDNFLSA